MGFYFYDNLYKLEKEKYVNLISRKDMIKYLENYKSSSNLYRVL